MKTLILTFIAVSMLAFASAELQQKSVFDGQMEIQVPADFKELSQDEINYEYQQSSPPDVVYASPEKEVQLSFKRFPKAISKDDLKQLLPKLTGNIKRAEGVEIIKDKIRKINGNQYGFVEYSQQDSTSSLYYQVFFTALQGELMKGSFHCPLDQKEAWTETMDEVISSIQLK